MTTVELRGETAIVHVAGDRLDAAAMPAFKAALETGLPTNLRRLIIDLGDVKFVDSTGLGAIVSLLKQVPDQGKLMIASAGPTVARLLQITGLNRVFPQFDSVEEALAEIGD